MSIRDRLDKARLEVNGLKNAAARALYAIDKALEECGCNEEHEHPAPTPTPTPSAWVKADSVPVIASNFDEAAWIDKRAVHVDGDAGEPLGAFRMTANVSHFGYIDPIVAPGVKALHLHMFWGNSATNIHSTYDTLRATGTGTAEGGPMHRSAEWIPAVLLGGFAAVPAYVTKYYKRHAKLADFPQHVPDGCKGLRDLPRGLRAIGEGGSYRVVRKSGEAVRVHSDGDVAALLATVVPGDAVFVEVGIPDCWDGQHIDNPDHMAHLATATRDRNAGRLVMPETHPYLITHVTSFARFDVQEGDRWDAFRLSSDAMMGTKPGGSLHYDYWEAQSPTAHDEWHRNAIERRLNCSGGDMGSGRGLKRPPTFTFNQGGRIPLADIPTDGSAYRMPGHAS